ncbi:unnamed protein product, partial [Sphacelaria rigidula]
NRPRNNDSRRIRDFDESVHVDRHWLSPGASFGRYSTHPDVDHEARSLPRDGRKSAPRSESTSWSKFLSSSRYSRERDGAQRVNCDVARDNIEEDFGEPPAGLEVDG